MPAMLPCSQSSSLCCTQKRRRPPCLRSQQPPQAEHTFCDPQPHVSMSSVPKEKVLEVMKLFSGDCHREESCGHGQWQWEEGCIGGQMPAATLLGLLVVLHSPWVSHAPGGIYLLGGELWLSVICLWGKPFSFCYLSLLHFFPTYIFSSSNVNAEQTGCVMRKAFGGWELT